MDIASKGLELVGGAVLGSVFNELVTAVKKAKKTAEEFKAILDRLETTLESVDPTIKDLDKRKQELDPSVDELKGLKQKLEEGKELVDKCSKVAWYELRKKPKYKKELQELDTYIVRFFGINMNAQIARDCVEILGTIKGATGSFVFCGAPEPPALTVGLDAPLKQLKTQFFKDDSSVLVLSAPGGCGKSTLAKMFCHDEEVKGKFKDNIFFVTVSKTPNLMVIIKKLFQHKSYPVPEFQNDENAINCLELLLKKIGTDPVLLVLDDVWSGQEDLIGNFVFKIPGYKILVTSRSTFPRFVNTFPLKLLNDEDSRTLFCCSAFSQNWRPCIPEDLVKKIVRRYKGWPLALTVVGRSLHGQPADVWLRRVTGWSKGQSIFDSEIGLLNRLQTSFDALDDIMKECFLDISSFIEDQRIPAAALIDMWVELYKLDEGKCVDNLHELSTRNLVNLVATRKDTTEVDGCYNEHYVTQHDLLRDLAIHQSRGDPLEKKKRLTANISGNNLPTWFMEMPVSVRLLSVFTDLVRKWLMNKHQFFSVRVLSIFTDDTFSSSWCNMHLPEVEVLILNFRTKKYTLPEFMEKMEKLKVLIVMNDGVCPAKLTNFGLLGSLSNLKRIRLEHICIPSLSETTTQLKSLQKISFVMCKVDQAFKSCTIHLPVMLPNLIEIYIDNCNDLKELPAGLCDIVNLKKLSITNCLYFSELPKGIGNLKNLEFLTLRACTDLSELPNSIGGLHELKFLDISDCYSMKRIPEQIGELCNLSTLYMRGYSRVTRLPPSIENLTNLTHVICDEERSNLWKDFNSCLPNLNVTVPEENHTLNWTNL